MYTIAHRPIPSTTLTLSPREIELVLRSLAESIEEEEDYGNHEQACELAAIQRRFAKAHSSLITH